MSVYGALLARPGARALACACALGWLSFGGLMLGTVLAAEAASGSFATAGAAAGAFAAASALLAPLRGRLVDRRGPTALIACALLHTCALCAFAWMAAGGAGAGGAVAGAGAGGAVGAAASGAAGAAATGAAAGGAGTGATTALLIACAALAGASAPPLIAAARALWPRVAGAELARTGHALNALLGDLGGVAGPALAALLATVAAPAAVPAALAVGPLAGALLLARIAPAAPAPPDAPAPPAALVPRGRPELCHPMRAQRVLDDTGPVEGAAERRGVVRGNRGMQALLAADLVAGLALGAAEVLAPAQAAAAGAPQLAALPLMLLAAASALAALRIGRAAAPPPAAPARTAAARHRTAAPPPAAPARTAAARHRTAAPPPAAPPPAAPARTAAARRRAVTARVRGAGPSGAGTPARRAAGGVGLLAIALPVGLASGTLVAAAPPPLALVPLCLACAVAGAGHGRFAVALLELLDTLVSARNAVEALTWLTSAQGAGLALGALGGGVLA